MRPYFNEMRGIRVDLSINCSQIPINIDATIALIFPSERVVVQQRMECVMRE